MRSIILNIIICFLLIIVQSLYLNSINFYDLLIPWIIFLFISEKESSSVKIILFILFAGYLKDSMSGGTFGVYFFTYLWFYFILCFLDSVFNIKNYFLMYLSGLFALILEAFFLFAANFPFYGMESLLNKVYLSFLKEIGWGIITLFFFIRLFFKINGIYSRFILKFNRNVFCIDEG